MKLSSDGGDFSSKKPTPGYGGARVGVWRSLPLFWFPFSSVGSLVLRDGLTTVYIHTKGMGKILTYLQLTTIYYTVRKNVFGLRDNFYRNIEQYVSSDYTYNRLWRRKMREASMCSNTGHYDNNGIETNI
jgi:hypothetical protein